MVGYGEGDLARGLGVGISGVWAGLGVGNFDRKCRNFMKDAGDDEAGEE